MVAPNNYTHVEYVTEDPEASARFHEKAYGWTIQRFGPDLGNYIMYTTPGGISGGFRKPEKGESIGVVPYVETENLDLQAKALIAAGATQRGPKQEIPGFGSMAMFLVPGGTVEALWQSAKA